MKRSQSRQHKQGPYSPATATACYESSKMELHVGLKALDEASASMIASTRRQQNHGTSSSNSEGVQLSFLETVSVQDGNATRSSSTSQDMSEAPGFASREALERLRLPVIGCHLICGLRPASSSLRWCLRAKRSDKSRATHLQKSRRCLA